MKKRILSALLTFCMVLTLLPVSTLAAETEDGGSEPASYGASFDGEPIMLTKKEFDLLNYLWQHEGTAVTRDELLSNVWGYEFAGDTNIVDVYIRYLRQKIDDKFGVKTIHTIRAVGYMFRYE